jgi:hypothetical protein
MLAITLREVNYTSNCMQSSVSAFLLKCRSQTCDAFSFAQNAELTFSVQMHLTNREELPINAFQLEMGFGN